MKVKVLKSVVDTAGGDFRSYSAGEVVDLPKAKADSMVEAGHAVVVEAPKRKRLAGPPENKDAS